MTESATNEESDARQRGMAKMQEVYGFSVDPDTVGGEYVDVTVDHLFGDIWSRPALDIRDRRMLTIGVIAAMGQPQLLEIQFNAALDRGELDCQRGQTRQRRRLSPDDATPTRLRRPGDRSGNSNDVV